MLHVICDTLYVWHRTHDIPPPSFCPFLSVWVLVLLSAHVERFSVSCMRDFHYQIFLTISEQSNTVVLPLLHFTRLPAACNSSCHLAYTKRKYLREGHSSRVAKRKLLSLTTAPGFIVRLLVLTGVEEGTCRQDLSIDVSDSIRFMLKSYISGEKDQFLNWNSCGNKNLKKWRKQDKELVYQYFRKCVVLLVSLLSHLTVKWWP